MRNLLQTRQALAAEAAAMDTEALREEVRATHQADAEAESWEDEPSGRRWAWTHVCEDELRRRAEVCVCGHARGDHDGDGCDVVVRGDGTGCPCRAFRADTGRERGDDDGVEYGHPDDEMDERRLR